jgi:hypothetical protein
LQRHSALQLHELPTSPEFPTIQSGSYASTRSSDFGMPSTLEVHDADHLHKEFGQKGSTQDTAPQIAVPEGVCGLEDSTVSLSSRLYSRRPSFTIQSTWCSGGGFNEQTTNQSHGRKNFGRTVFCRFACCAQRLRSTASAGRRHSGAYLSVINCGIGSDVGSFSNDCGLEAALAKFATLGTFKRCFGLGVWSPLLP